MHNTAQLGELVVAAFDLAAARCEDQRDVPRVATQMVMHLLRRAPHPIALRPRKLSRGHRVRQVDA
jgi:hypothetical protein